LLTGNFDFHHHKIGEQSERDEKGAEGDNQLQDQRLQHLTMHGGRFGLKFNKGNYINRSRTLIDWSLINDYCLTDDRVEHRSMIDHYHFATHRSFYSKIDVTYRHRILLGVKGLKMSNTNLPHLFLDHWLAL